MSSYTGAKCRFSATVFVSSDCSEEDKKWFAEAMQAQTVDVIKRMKEISMVMNMPTEVLQSQGVSIEELQGEVLELDCALWLAFRV